MPLNDEWKKEYADENGLFGGGLAPSAGEPGGTVLGDGNRRIFRCFAVPGDRETTRRNSG
jgi:hypothetical protein